MQRGRSLDFHRRGLAPEKSHAGHTLSRVLSVAGRNAVSSAVEIPPDFLVRVQPRVMILSGNAVGNAIRRGADINTPDDLMQALLNSDVIDTAAATQPIEGLRVAGVRATMSENNAYAGVELLLEDRPSAYYTALHAQTQIIGEIIAAAAVAGTPRSALYATRALVEAEARHFPFPRIGVVLAVLEPADPGHLPTPEQLVPDPSLLPQMVDVGPLTMLPIM